MPRRHRQLKDNAWCGPPSQWRTEGGAEGAIRPGRHSGRGGKKGKKQKKKGKREKGKKGKIEKRKKKKIWEKHVIAVKLKWNILAAAPLYASKT